MIVIIMMKTIAPFVPLFGLEHMQERKPHEGLKGFGPRDSSGNNLMDFATISVLFDRS